MFKILSWLAVLFWMALIFNLSAQVAEQSNQLSMCITEFIVKIIAQITPGAELDVESFNHIIRKNAHFLAYLVLGFLVHNALGRSGVSGSRGLVLALGVCILYAVSDEVHQLFVPGRGGQVQDVLIDSAGSGVGIGLYTALAKLGRNWAVSQGNG